MYTYIQSIICSILSLVSTFQSGGSRYISEQNINPSFTNCLSQSRILHWRQNDLANSLIIRANLNFLVFHAMNSVADYVLVHK